MKADYKNLCILLVYINTYSNMLHGAYSVKLEHVLLVSGKSETNLTATEGGRIFFD